jgi:hypothetical protein
MGVLQTGSTLFSDGTSSGLTQVVYGCDGCEARTGDMYARIAFVEISRRGEWDESEIEGWTFFDGYCYCPDCVREWGDKEPAV